MVTRSHLLLSWLCLCCGAIADYRDTVAYTFWTNQLGGLVPSGTGITLSQIESTGGGSNYLADSAHPELAGKNVLPMSGGSTGISSHATEVLTYFCGISTGMVPGVTTVAAYYVGDWVGSGMLLTGSSSAPLEETNDVELHAWIGASSDTTNIMLRLDHAIARDGFVCVTASDNGGGTNLPQLPSQGYNTLSVGRSDGGHSAGFTTVDAQGRIKPDLVAPLPTCSLAVPVVGAAVGLLTELAATNLSLAEAAHPEAIKALLMAGATKDDVPDWDRTSSRPLDERYGAGELNLFNSHRILMAGFQSAAATSLVALAGWSVQTAAPSTSTWYYFDVPTGRVLSSLSAVLAWNREVMDGPIPFTFDPVATVANLNLALYSASNLTPVTLLDESTSAVDNVEHVYVRGLPAGGYGLRVTADSSARYCLAWEGRCPAVPAITETGYTNDSITIGADATAGYFHTLETSTNLVDAGGGWVRIQTRYAETNRVEFDDPVIPGTGRVFFRIRSDP